MKITNKKPSAVAKVKSKPKSSSKLKAQVDASNGVMVSMAAVPALIGLWAAACFIGGIISSGGPIAMMRNWFSAVLGS